MEAIPKLHSAYQPKRSISLPNRVHPSSQRVEALLNHLKQQHHHHQSKPISSTICLDSDAIQSDLVLLAEFYNCMEELLNSPQNQQVLVHFQNGKLVEDSLCGSLTLLDACGVARDLLLAMKEHVQTLQSAMRRRRNKGDSSIERSICEYERFRKKAKKEISKQICSMKRMENNNNKTQYCFSQLGHDQSLVFLARVLGDARTITISILGSLLVFLSMPRVKKTKGSSLMSKIRSTGLFSSNSEKGHKSEDNKVVEAQVLETLNVGIGGIEGALDCIFRCLVKNRVSFLNMLAH